MPNLSHILVSFPFSSLLSRQRILPPSCIAASLSKVDAHRFECPVGSLHAHPPSCLAASPPKVDGQCFARPADSFRPLSAPTGAVSPYRLKNDHSMFQPPFTTVVSAPRVDGKHIEHFPDLLLISAIPPTPATTPTQKSTTSHVDANLPSRQAIYY